MLHPKPICLLVAVAFSALVAACTFASTNTVQTEVASGDRPTRTPVPTWTPTSTPAPLPSPATTATESPTSTVEPKLTPVPTITFTPIPEEEAIPTATVDSTSRAANQANLRSGPGTNYAIVGQVQQGDPVQIVARTEDAEWYQVEFADSGRAWIAAFLVEGTPAGDSLPIAASIPEPPPTATPVAGTITSSTASSANLHLDFIQQFSAIANEANEYFPHKDGHSNRQQYEILVAYKRQVDSLSTPDTSYAKLMRTSFNLFLLGAAGFHLKWYHGDPVSARYQGDEAMFYYGEYLSYRFLYLRSIGLSEEQAGFKGK